MPLYHVDALIAGTADDRRLPLAERLQALEDAVQRGGGRLSQALMLTPGEWTLTIETPDELSWFRAVDEAARDDITLRARVALPRHEAEALDDAQRARRAHDDSKPA